MHGYNLLLCDKQKLPQAPNIRNYKTPKSNAEHIKSILELLESMDTIDFVAFYEDIINAGKQEFAAQELREAVNELQNKFGLFMAKAKEYKIKDMENDHKEIVSFIKVVLAEYLVSPGLPLECLPKDLSFLTNAKADNMKDFIQTNKNSTDPFIQGALLGYYDSEYNHLKYLMNQVAVNPRVFLKNKIEQLKDINATTKIIYDQLNEIKPCNNESRQWLSQLLLDYKALEKQTRLTADKTDAKTK